MLKLIIEDDEGRKTVVPFVRDEITIGRQEGNTIRLTERNVSRRHARLVRLNGHVVVEDLGSYNGTRINGERIAGQSPLNEGDLIQIGDYDLALQAEGAANAVGAITTKVPARRQEPEPESESESTQDEEAPGQENDHTPASADKRRNSTSIIRLDHVEADRPRKVVDLDEKEAPQLVVLTPDELRGQQFSCIRTELRIGRTDDNDITLDHRSLSRTHAKLVREDAGEWRVIDMQSANGMTVNGESYAQATLNSGDIIELGHVKLRFVAAGDSTDDVGANEGGGVSKLLVVASLAAVLLGGGGVVWWMNHQEQGATQPGHPVVAVTPPAETPPAPPVEKPKPSPAEEVKAAPTQTAETVETPPEPEKPATPPGPDVPKLLAKAEAEMKSGDFQGAKTTLEGIKAPEAERLFNEATNEASYKELLATARTALANNELAEARESLEGAAKTQRLQGERRVLLAELKKKEDEAKAAAQPVAAPPVATASPKPAPTEKAAESPVEAALNEGKARLGEKKYSEAVQSFKRCLELNPKYVDCHVYLGSALARDGKPAEGAKYYNSFLELAPPTHPRYQTVKGYLEEYEKGRK
ncbi:FHA domain-containing protein [Myxococcus stipitatus]|uniref:FHA domain-containing protein n=1 Tax=Myxococcus stipitatus TaxID=83455 RepID=UPI001F314277|nr:FHA domain-containing protein [Myxococcus stipitatus]MCE9667579.1 FHA domain-containing protein [Myxococcus stipitatus]